mgnify:FL=1
MQFTYKTATGNITIDVDEEWVAILQDCDREEYNNDHAETRRHYHFEACEYEGQDYADDDDAIERLLEAEAARSTVLPLLEKLTPAQWDVIDAIFYKGMTARECSAFGAASLMEPLCSRSTRLRGGWIWNISTVLIGFRPI